MKKVLLSMLLCMWFMSQTSNGQTFVGFGLGAAMPQTQFPEQSDLGLHGELQYVAGIHRELWLLWPDR